MMLLFNVKQIPTQVQSFLSARFSRGSRDKLLESQVSEVVDDEDIDNVLVPIPQPRKRRSRLRRCLRRRSCLTTLIVMMVIFANCLWIVPLALNPNIRTAKRRAADNRWVKTSPYFFDRMACRMVTLCGLHHIRKDKPGNPFTGSSTQQKRDIHQIRLLSAKDRLQTSTARRQNNTNDTSIPDFVMKHAPLVHLHDKENFFPADIDQFLNHVNVTVRGTSSKHTADIELSLDHLASLNQFNETVSLKSVDNVESRPDWLYSHANIPLSSDSSQPDYDTDDMLQIPAISGHKPNQNGYSAAPAVLILVDKGNGILDAFWFFFYAYNFGQTVMGMRFGNHVGDWEHTMIRFSNSEPVGVFLSAHKGGLCYTWDAVEKRSSDSIFASSSSSSTSTTGDRPVVYSAIGSHAMYPKSGNHPYVLPFNMLKDVTSAGALWDPSLNNYAFHYDASGDKDLSSQKDSEKDNDYDGDAEVDLTAEDAEIDDSVSDDPGTLVPASTNPDMPTSWFHFRGAWGDDVYALRDKRQYRLFGQYHYVRGPKGPKWKKLGREHLCPKRKCKLLHDINKKVSWRG